MIDLCGQPLWTKDLADPFWGKLPDISLDKRLSATLISSNMNFRGSVKDGVSFNIEYVDVHQYHGETVLVHATRVEPTTIIASHCGYQEICPFLGIAWPSNLQNYVDLGYDEASGQPAPAWVTVVPTPYDTRTGKFRALDPVLHRVDYPATLITSHLVRQYESEASMVPSLISAKTLVANWYLNGSLNRWDGPRRIVIKDYKEFYEDGVLVNATWSDGYVDWGSRGVPRHIEGPSHLLGVKYFGDPQDELFWAAQRLTSAA